MPSKTAPRAPAGAPRKTASRRRTPAPRAYGGVSGDVRRAERRERFVQAGIQLFGTAGYAATTTRNLCAEAGLTQRYFYESFDSLDSLFIEVVNLLGERLHAQLLQAIAQAPEDPEARVAATLHAYFNGIRSDARVGRILLAEIYGVGGRTEPLVRGFVAGFAEIVRLNLIGAYPALAQRRDIDVRMLAAGCIGATHHIALNWVLGGYAEPVASIARTAGCIYSGAVREALGEAAPPAKKPRKP